MARVVRRSETEQHELRCALIAEYRRWPFYVSHIAQSLQPRWKRLHRRYKWDEHTDFWRVQSLAEDQSFAEEDGEGSRDAELSAYVEGLLKTVARHMGLLVGGDPAPWALSYVHLDATKPFGRDDSLSPALAVFPKWERIGLTFLVREWGARISLTHHDDTTDEMAELNSSGEVFQAWDDLRRLAHVVVDEELTRMQGEFERAYAAKEGPYTRRYQSALYNPEDIALLRELLTATPNRRPKLDRAKRERLRRCAKTIGIDFPRA